MKRDRKFGLAADATVGGSDYDKIQTAPTSGVIPPPTEWWPVTEVTYDKGITNNTHENQVRGYRGQPPPEPFTRRPSLTVVVDAYFEILARSIYWAYGMPNARTGVAPAALTDALQPIPYGSSAQPTARHLTWVRDGLIQRMSGAQINTWSLNMPKDDDAVLTLGWMGLYAQQRPTAEAQGTPDFGSLAATTLKLRDVSLFIDGALEQVPDVELVTLSFGNQMEPKEFGGRNVVPDPSDPCQKIWLPAENRFGPDQDIGYGITFGNPDTAEELKQDFARASKLVFEVEECPIATVPPAVRLFRHTIASAVHTGGGAGNLTKGDDITSAFTGSGYHSSVDGFDIKSEFVHNTTALLAA